MQDSGETRPENIPETSRYTAITVAEAAHRLGLTEDAVRKRLQRGTLEGIKTGGTWDVIETDELKHETPPGTGERQDTVSGRHESISAVSDSALVEHLQGEAEYLRDQLATTIQQLAAERERADVLQREALGRIEALAAGQGHEGHEGHDQVSPRSPTGAFDAIWGHLEPLTAILAGGLNGLLPIRYWC